MRPESRDVLTGSSESPESADRRYYYPNKLFAVPGINADNSGKDEKSSERRYYYPNKLFVTPGSVADKSGKGSEPTN